MLNLYLLRHGKARTDVASGKDFDRKLNKKGSAQIMQIGHILQQKGVKIDQILASGAVRTVETTEIVNHFLHVSVVKFIDEMFLASAESIIECLNADGQGSNLLYVGHNFGISDICGLLTGENLSLSTAQLVHISFNFDDWKIVGRDTGSFEGTVVPNVQTF